MSNFDLSEEETFNNLKFLLSVSEKTLFSWISEMESEDLYYGISLLKKHIEEVQNKINLIQIELQMKELQKQKFYPDAKRIIHKIKRGLI